MKKLTALILCAALMLSFPYANAYESPQPVSDYESEISVYDPSAENIEILPDGSAYVNNCISVYLKENYISSQLNKVLDTAGGEIAGFFTPLNHFQIKIKKTSFENIQRICNILMSFDFVELAVPSFAEKYSDDFIPSDPWNGEKWQGGIYPFQSQWWIRAVEADKAWDYNDYFHKIKVGIVDSGFDTSHEELSGRITFPSKYLEKSNHPEGHGTHVAGIIGAAPNNNKGITGLVWNCELSCVDWNPSKENHQLWITDERIMTGLVCNVIAGAKVVNFSLGSSGNILNGTTQRYKIAIDSEALVTSYVISKLLSKGYDFLAVQSAGNGTTVKNGDFFAVDAVNNGTFACVTPENAFSFAKGVTKKDILDRIIIVGSAQCNDFEDYSMSYFSNGGSNVSIYAPGSGIYSTYYDSSLEGSYRSCYRRLSGTSMACPIVTGIASMVWSVNPDMTGPQVKKIICDPNNTPITVKDCTDASHLPQGDGKMINARLSVEDAISQLERCGTVSGKINHNKIGKNEIPYIITDINTGETYRGRTDEKGSYSKYLPSGSYTISFTANGETLSSDFSVESGKSSVTDELYAESEAIHIFAKLSDFFAKSESFFSGIAKTVFRIFDFIIKYIVKAG